MKAGYRIASIEPGEIHIGEPRSLLEVARKHFYYGRTLSRFIAKHGGRGIAQLSPVRPSYLRNWRRFVRHPVLTLGFIVYQAVRYSSALAGLVWGGAERILGRAKR